MVFGRAFLANPDLPKRLLEGKPLAQPDYGSLYGPYGVKGEDYPWATPEALAKGYTDYPAA